LIWKESLYNLKEHGIKVGICQIRRKPGMNDGSTYANGE